jgi:hypothetical protein
MKQEFTAYLEQLGATKPIQDKVEYFYRLCSNMLPYKPLVDIFVDDYLAEDKSRKYVGLSFYSKDYIFAVPNFLTQNRIVVGRHRTVQDNVEIIFENFDFRKANDQSLMTIILHHGSSTTGQYRASQKNCEHLTLILRKYIQPTL